MKLLRPLKKSEQEEESVFVPMTDMTVSFLFIMMILVAFFAVTAQFEEETIPLSVHEEAIKTKDQKINEQNTLILTQKIEIETLLERINELYSDLRELLNNVENLKKDLKTAEDEITYLRKEILSLKQDVDELKKLVANLEAKLDEVQTENKELKNNLLVTNQKLEKQAETLKEKQSEIERLKLIIEDLSRMLNVAREEVISLNQRLENSELALNERDRIIEEQNVEIKKLKIEISKLLELLKTNPLEIYLAEAQAKRLEILKQIEKKLQLEFKDEILVEVSPENDALRFKGDGLFSSGSHKLIGQKRRIIERLAVHLTEAVQCFTVNSQQLEIGYQICNPNGIVIEAIQIEGHTDSDGSIYDNLSLSTRRSREAYFVMSSEVADFLGYKNIRQQPVISVSGYGEDRPIKQNISKENKAENRRIDIRLIMYTPKNRKKVEELRSKVQQGLSLAFGEK